MLAPTAVYGYHQRRRKNLLTSTFSKLSRRRVEVVRLHGGDGGAMGKLLCPEPPSRGERCRVSDRSTPAFSKLFRTETNGPESGRSEVVSRLHGVQKIAGSIPVAPIQDRFQKAIPRMRNRAGKVLKKRRSSRDAGSVILIVIASAPSVIASGSEAIPFPDKRSPRRSAARDSSR